MLLLKTIFWFRPGEKITRKTIMMANKMKELDMKETSSKVKLIYISLFTLSESR